MLDPKHSELRVDFLLPPITHCTHTSAPMGYAVQEAQAHIHRGVTVTQEWEKVSYQRDAQRKLKSQVQAIRQILK